MSRYFTVQPEAVGTRSVESFSSAIQRIAVIHGVTRHQFITSLRYWWKVEHGRHLPRCEELRWDGYSPNVALAVEAFRDATHIDFKGCTLLPLMGTCAGNCIGSISQVRHWCPACLSEDLASGRPPYDRLMWRIQGYRRCSIHKLTLRTTCPHCQSDQTRGSTRDLDLCVFCYQSLATRITKSEYSPRPLFGEAQIESLVESIGLIGDCRSQPLRIFLRHVDGSEKYVGKHLGDIIHNRTIPAKPQLSSLIAVATHFGADIVQLITAPEQAAQQASLNIRRPPYARSARPSSHFRGRRTSWFRAQLEQALVSGPPFLSVDEFCRRNDYSVSAARNTFPSLTSRLSAEHLKWKTNKANKLKGKAISAIAELSDSRPQLTVKEFVRAVCSRSGAPVHVVRALIDDSRSDDGASHRHLAWRKS